MLAGHLEEAHALAERALALTRERQQRGLQAYALRLLGAIAAQREPLEHQQAEAPERPVPPVQRERSGPAHRAGHDDDIQVTFLRSCPMCDPHAPAGTHTFC